MYIFIVHIGPPRYLYIRIFIHMRVPSSPPLTPKVSVDGERIFSLLIIYLLLHVDRQGLQIHAFETYVVRKKKKNKKINVCRTGLRRYTLMIFFPYIFTILALQVGYYFRNGPDIFLTAPRRKNATRNLERTY